MKTIEVKNNLIHVYDNGTILKTAPLKNTRSQQSLTLSEDEELVMYFDLLPNKIATIFDYSKKAESSPSYNQLRECLEHDLTYAADF